MDKIKKLIERYRSDPNSHEGQIALIKAFKLIDSNGLKLEDYGFGNAVTEYKPKKYELSTELKTYPVTKWKDNTLKVSKKVFHSIVKTTANALKVIDAKINTALENEVKRIEKKKEIQHRQYTPQHIPQYTPQYQAPRRKVSIRFEGTINIDVEEY